MLAGGCLCGGVRYEVEAIDFMHHCHCSICRKTSGGAYGTFAHARASVFRWRSGTDLLGSYASSARRRRAFCRVCGAKMPVVHLAEDHVAIPAGTFDDDPGARPIVHTYVASKAAWHEIGDDLPRLDAGPPDA